MVIFVLLRYQHPLPLIMEILFFIIAAFLLSVGTGWVIIPRIVMISKKKRLFDELSARKSHTGMVPRLGGASFFPTFLFAFTLTMGMRYIFGYDVADDYFMDSLCELMFLLAGSTVLFCVGMADDLTGVGYKGKFLAQTLSAVLICCSGVEITSLDGLFGIYEIPYGVGIILTVLIIVLLVNAYNLIDGIDGLCSGLSLLALLTFGLWFIVHGIYVYAMMAMAMAGVVLVFFFYNVLGKRLKVFMGDTGSLLLGYLIAFLGLKFYSLNVSGEFFRINAAPAVFLGVVSIPVFDVVRVFCARMAAGLSPFYPDRRHIHHKLLRIGLTHLQSAMVIVLLQVGFILLNFLLRNVSINLLLAINIALGFAVNYLLNVLGGRYVAPQVQQNVPEHVDKSDE